MDFSLTEEQQLLQDSINQFVEREYTFDDRKKFLDSEKGFNEENSKTGAALRAIDVWATDRTKT